jgi:hypothetical protein
LPIAIAPTTPSIATVVAKARMMLGLLLTSFLEQRETQTGGCSGWFCNVRRGVQFASQKRQAWALGVEQNAKQNQNDELFAAVVIRVA